MPADALVPATVEARAQPNGRLPFAFGPRFFIALLLGLFWILPAWWSPRWIAIMFVWDLFVLVAWYVDLRNLPAPSQLEARRVWSSPLALARETSVGVELRNHSSVSLRVVVVDETPSTIRDEPPSLITDLPSNAAAGQSYPILPRKRGDISLGRLFLRYQTSLRIAERWAVADLSQTVRVLPDIEQAKRHALYLIRSRQVEMERRRRSQRGLGREFETLREYRQGDDMRDICWPATARRNQLTTRTYQVERSQAVWIVLDAGRLLGAEVLDPESAIRRTKLDYAVDAALSLAQVVSQSGDRVGLIAYGRSIQKSIGLGRGSLHLRSVLDALALVRHESPEANHAGAVRLLLRKQTRRSLIVWITDFAETATTPEVIEYAAKVRRRHLVAFAALSQPDLLALARSIPQTEEAVFRHAAALEMMERRDLLLRGLRESGVLAVDLAPGVLASTLINQYLEIKDRSSI